MEGPAKRAMRAADGHLAFLHRLQKRRLRARAGPVYLVGHQKLGEDRAFDKAELPPPVAGHVQHFRAEDIGRHQVGRELDARILKAQHRRQRIDQHGLAQARLADQKRMATGQNRGQNLLDHLVLADEAPLDAAARLQQAVAQIGNLVNQFVILGHDNSLILLYDI